jgi:hypothetical protein
MGIRIQPLIFLVGMDWFGFSVPTRPSIKMQGNGLNLFPLWLGYANDVLKLFLPVDFRVFNK